MSEKKSAKENLAKLLSYSKMLIVTAAATYVFPEEILNNFRYFIKENKDCIENVPEKRSKVWEKAFENVEDKESNRMFQE